MAEKTFSTESTPVRERFDFVLSVNGNIIVKRNFKINDFNERSLGSTHVKDAIEQCVALIQDDLKSKSNIYLHYTAPQVFATKDEMNRWVANPTFKLENPSYVILRDSEDVYVWNGEEMLPYDKPFNRNDYVEEPTAPCVLKFAFFENGNEVQSLSWDGNVYPKFVRSNIDISNSNNKYKNDKAYAPMEAFLLDVFIASQKDLIPVIIRKISYACSAKNNGIYHSIEEYAGQKYDFNIYQANENYERKVEAQYRRKTEEYFKSIAD